MQEVESILYMGFWAPHCIHNYQLSVSIFVIKLLGQMFFNLHMQAKYNLSATEYQIKQGIRVYKLAIKR